LKLKTIPYFSH